MGGGKSVNCHRNDVGQTYTPIQRLMGSKKSHLWVITDAMLVKHLPFFNASHGCNVNTVTCRRNNIGETNTPFPPLLVGVKSHLWLVTDIMLVKNNTPVQRLTRWGSPVTCRIINVGQTHKPVQRLTWGVETLYMITNIILATHLPFPNISSGREGNPVTCQRNKFGRTEHPYQRIMGAGIYPCEFSDL